MIKRNALATLEAWKHQKKRKPLVLRGARQVGKTALVREFSKSFEQYIEVNFDETPDRGSYFVNNDVFEVIKILEVDSGVKCHQGSTLIFFDEVQSAPAVLPMLRYFYEKVPDLHVIAAGSLLEFLLADHNFSMPVGRIEYCFINPLSFEEFLKGMKQELLLDYVESFDFTQSIPEVIHGKLMKYLQTYILIGGMPEAMAKWFETEDFIEVQRVHASILQTYEDDFNKYGKRINTEALKICLKKSPKLIGEKLRYTNLDRDITPSSLNKALGALSSARVLSQVFHSDGNGIPLGAEINHKKFKLLFLDSGLHSSSLSLRLTDLHEAGNIMMVNSGACSEQYVGQQLLNTEPYWQKPELFYWHREKKGSNSEVDYLINDGPKVLPVEVKAGKTGTLRSLHTFMASKTGTLAIRFNADLPSITDVNVSINQVGNAEYKLLSLPLYMVGHIRKLLKTLSATQT